MDEAVMIVVYTFTGIGVVVLAGMVVKTMLNIVKWHKKKDSDSSKDFVEDVIFQPPIMVPIGITLFCFAIWLCYQLGNYLLN